MESSISSFSLSSSFPFSDTPNGYSYDPNTPTPPQMLWQAPQLNFGSYQQSSSGMDWWTSSFSSSSLGSGFLNLANGYSYHPNTPTPPQMLWQAPHYSYQQYLSSNDYYMPAIPSSQLMTYPISFSLNATDAKPMEPVKRVPRTRICYTPEQLKSLKKHFDLGITDQNEYSRIAAELGIQRKQVKVWFQNRKADLKKKHLVVTGE